MNNTKHISQVTVSMSDSCPTIQLLTAGSWLYRLLTKNMKRSSEIVRRLPQGLVTNADNTFI